jgi:GNAT superfamily N-acetyltransferase
MKDLIKSQVKKLLSENENDIDISKIKVQKRNINNLLVFSPFYNGEKMGAFRIQPYGNNYSVYGALLYDRFRGKGIGKRMYKYMIKQLKKENKILYSDLRQTPDAKRVWDSLVRDGYASFDGERFHSI